MHEMEQVYREYSVPVYRYLNALTQDAQLAEELTQETFCEAVRCIGRYDGSCKMITWLCQIGKHKWYDHLKRQKHRSHLDFSALNDREADWRTSPEQTVEAEDAATRLYRCIHQLPPEGCEIMLLRILAGLSFRQIGAILGITENAARVKFYRAKTQIAARLEQEGAHHG